LSGKPLGMAAMTQSLPRAGPEPAPAAGGSDEAQRPNAFAWAQRVRAQAFDPLRARELFLSMWRADRHGMALAPAELVRLAEHFSYFSVPAAQQVIVQDERGDYLLVVLEGRLAVEHVRPDGSRARLAEAGAGEMLGEMALLDAGARSSACTSLGSCVLAVLDARQLEDLLEREPRLALALLASLARRLSLRLRQVSARLSALLAGG
jgi:CRP-like cAMP-binding protein